MTTFNDLPNDMIKHILSFISQHDAISRQVCKRWYGLITRGFNLSERIYIASTRDLRIEPRNQDDIKYALKWRCLDSLNLQYHHRPLFTYELFDEIAINDNDLVRIVDIYTDYRMIMYLSSRDRVGALKRISLKFVSIRAIIARGS